MAGAFTAAIQTGASSPLLGGGNGETCCGPKDDDAPQQFTSTMARWAFLIIIIYLLGGATIFFLIEKDNDVDWGSAMYVTVLTITTVGYGDIVPQTDGGKIFIIFYIFFGLSVVAACFGLAAAQVAGMKSYLPGNPKPRERTLCTELRTVIVPMIIVVSNMLIMALVIHFNEDVDWVTSFYWAMVSISSVGYGDPTIMKESTRIFLTVFLLWAVTSVAWALGKIAEVVRLIEEDNELAHFIEHGVTKALIKEMDTDGGGSIDREEFLQHMLVKLNRVRQSDMDEIIALFNKFDRDGSGSIDEHDIAVAKKDPPPKDFAKKDPPKDVEKEKLLGKTA